MGLNLSVNILTSGFLVTVVVFLVLMGVLFYMASLKMGDILLTGIANPVAAAANPANLAIVNNALGAAKIALILAFVAAGLSVLLALLYAGHELLFSLSEYFHLVLYLIIYVLLVISVVYASIALYRLYNLSVPNRNGADSFIWAGLLMAIFAFVGLTATGSGRLGMNVARDMTRKRLERAEESIHTYLPAIHEDTQTIPLVHAKVHNVHKSVVVPSVPSVSTVNSPMTNISGFRTIPTHTIQSMPTHTIPRQTLQLSQTGMQNYPQLSQSMNYIPTMSSQTVQSFQNIPTHTLPSQNILNIPTQMGSPMQYGNNITGFATNEVDACLSMNEMPVSFPSVASMPSPISFNYQSQTITHRQITEPAVSPFDFVLQDPDCVEEYQI